MSVGPDVFVIDLMNLLGAKLHSNWLEFGYHLKLSMEELYRIEMNVGQDSERCTRQLLFIWRKLNPTSSWEPIVEALKQSGLSLLSVFVTKRYENSSTDFNDVHIHDVLASFPNSKSVHNFEESGLTTLIRNPVCFLTFAFYVVYG